MEGNRISRSASWHVDTYIDEVMENENRNEEDLRGSSQDPDVTLRHVPSNYHARGERNIGALGEMPLHSFLNVSSSRSDSGIEFSGSLQDFRKTKVRERTKSGIKVNKISDAMVGKREERNHVRCCNAIKPFRGIREDVKNYVTNGEGPNTQSPGSTHIGINEHGIFWKKLFTRWLSDWTIKATFRDENSEVSVSKDFEKKRFEEDLNKYSCAYPWTIIRTTAFVLLSSIMSVLSMGTFYQAETDGKIGPLEALVSAGLAGILQSLLSGQPLVIMGNTGPNVMLYILLYKTAVDYNIPFFGWIGFTNMWAAIFLSIMSILNVSEVIYSFTRFTGEILEMVITLDLIVGGIEGIVKEWNSKENVAYSWYLVNGLLAIIFSVSHFVVSKFLINASSWTTLWHGGRTFISRFGAPISLIILTLISYFPSWIGRVPSDFPQRLSIASEWGLPKSEEAHWLNYDRMAQCSTAQAFAAIIPGLCVALLLLVDHNMTARLASDCYGLRCPSTRHYDMMILAINVLIAGLLGIPPSSAVVPINPGHTRALIKRKSYNEGKLLKIFDSSKKISQQQLAVIEQRFTNFFQSLLLLLCMFIMPLFGYIPSSMLWGYLLVLATETLDEGSEFFLRIKLLISSSSTRRCNRAAFLSVASLSTIFWYTVIQIILVLGIFSLQILQIVLDVNVGIVVYPLLIFACAIPIRSHILPHIFSNIDLEALDASEKLEREPPKQNTRTKLDLYDKAHKGGQPIRRHVTTSEMQSLLTRRDTN